MPKLAANINWMFNEFELLDRFEQAAEVGFKGVEILRPYEHTKEEIARGYRRHNLTAVLFNVAPGVGAVPGREDEFRSGLIRALEYAEAADCGQLHCVAGSTADPKAESTFIANLKWASREAESSGVRLLLEPLNTQDNPGYFLTHSTQARRIIEAVDRDNVFLQYDIYHMQIMEGYLAETIQDNLDIITHFQIGGVPGRHEPDDRQEINYPYLFNWIDSLGYDRWISCEYGPRGRTLDGLGWARPYGIG